MRTIDLAIVADYFPPDNKAVAIRMVHLAKALEVDNFAVTIYTSNKSIHNKDFKIKCNWFSAASNKDDTTIRLFKELFYSFETFIRILFSKHDHYLVTSPPFTIAFSACFALMLRGKKYILDVRDEYPEVYFEEGLVREHGPIGRLLRYFEKRLYKHALLITTVTERIRIKLRKKTNDVVPVWLMRNGYADGFFPVDYERQGPFTIIFHGNLGKFQHPRLIFEIAELCLKENLNIKFDIYGWGNNAHVLTEQNLPNLKHHGELSNLEVKKILPYADLGISFQRNTEISKNSFPSKVFEFIGAGIPVIVTPISEAGDFVEQHKLGFQFDPENKVEIFEKIKALMTDKTLYHTLKSNILTVREGLSRSNVSKSFARDLYAFLNHKK